MGFFLTGCAPKFNYYTGSDVFVEEGDYEYKSDDYGKTSVKDEGKDAITTDTKQSTSKSTKKQ